MTVRTAPRVNRFAGKCGRCSVWVDAGAGLIVKTRSGAWVVTHNGACPEAPAPVATLTADDLGIYVTPEGTAIRVVKGQMSGKFYTKTLVFNTVGDRTVMDWQYTPGLSVAGLPKMTTEFAAELGLKCSQCVSCLASLGGVSLSAKCSAVLGFGETCAGTNGWSYPKGVRAQRALLAEHGVSA